MIVSRFQHGMPVIVSCSTYIQLSPASCAGNWALFVRGTLNILPCHRREMSERRGQRFQKGKRWDKRCQIKIVQVKDDAISLASHDLWLNFSYQSVIVFSYSVHTHLSFDTIATMHHVSMRMSLRMTSLHVAPWPVVLVHLNSSEDEKKLKRLCLVCDCDYEHQGSEGCNTEEDCPLHTPLGVRLSSAHSSWSKIVLSTLLLE